MESFTVAISCSLVGNEECNRVMNGQVFRFNSLPISIKPLLVVGILVGVRRDGLQCRRWTKSSAVQYGDLQV